MERKREYWVPDYYEKFVCKCGECRHSCCSDWPISLSMEEYFRLLGMDCSGELRRKLDSAFHMADRPSPERYAQITPNWRGDCPLHMENGYCMLQAECGEEALTHICRYYPRSPRNVFAHECACSNSCEHTLELLMDRSDKLGFVQKELCFEESSAGEGAPDRLIRHYGEIRRMCLEMMQDRSAPLNVRVERIGWALMKLHEAFESESDERISEAVRTCMENPQSMQGAFPKNLIPEINRKLGMDSRSVHEYAVHAEEIFQREGAEKVFERFDENFPDWQIFFEHVMANHMFYESFPFSDRRESMKDEFISLLAVYGYTRWLAASWTFDHPSKEALIDVCAAAFRLIDHSPFDYNVSVIHHQLKNKTE